MRDSTSEIIRMSVELFLFSAIVIVFVYFSNISNSFIILRDEEIIASSELKEYREIYTFTKEIELTGDDILVFLSNTRGLFDVEIYKGGSVYKATRENIENGKWEVSSVSKFLKGNLKDKFILEYKKDEFSNKYIKVKFTRK